MEEVTAKKIDLTSIMGRNFVNSVDLTPLGFLTTRALDNKNV